MLRSCYRPPRAGNPRSPPGRGWHRDENQSHQDALQAPNQKRLGWKPGPTANPSPFSYPHSEWGAQTSSRSTTWELVRNEVPQAPAQTYLKFQTIQRHIPSHRRPSHLSPSNPNAQSTLRCSFLMLSHAQRNLSTHAQNFPKSKKCCTVHAYLHLVFFLNCTHLHTVSQ